MIYQEKLFLSQIRGHQKGEYVREYGLTFKPSMTCVKPRSYRARTIRTGIDYHMNGNEYA